MDKTISTQEFLAAQQAGPVTVVDVREAQEYVEGHVPGAIFAPMSRIHQFLAQIPRDQALYVICRSGNRSASITRMMSEGGGFTHVVDAGGGIRAWLGAGQPVAPCPSC